MAKAKDVIICLSLIIMDLAAGILGIEAQLAQNRLESYMKVSTIGCREPSYEAFKLALTALILLALAHTVALTLGGSICLSSKEEFASSPSNKKFAACSLMLTWILVLLAFSLLVLGAVSNATPQDTCGLSQQHVLLIGGVLCFIHGLFVAIYYASVTAFAEEEDAMINQQRSTA